MKRLRRLLARPPADWRLLIEAVLLLGIIRVGLRVLSFRRLCDLLDCLPRAIVPATDSGAVIPERVTWAVRVASPFILGTRPCLAQALAAGRLLVRRGFPVRLHLGVAKGDRGQLQAHAWMATSGRIVTGGSKSDLERYTPLLVLDTHPR